MVEFRKGIFVRAIVNLAKFLVFLTCIMPLFFVAINSLRLVNYDTLTFTDILGLDASKLTFTVHFANYLQFFQNPIYTQAVLISLILASVSTLVVVPFGFLIAWNLLRMRDRGLASIIHMLLMLPMFLPFIIRLYAWMYLSHNFLSLYSKYIAEQLTIVIFLVYSYLPMVIAIIRDDMEKIDPDIANAAADLGGRPIKVLTNIVLPLSLHSIMTSIIITFSLAIGEYIVPELLSGGTLLTIGELAQRECFTFHNLPMSSTLSIFMIFWSLMPMVVLRYVIRSRI